MNLHRFSIDVKRCFIKNLYESFLEGENIRSILIHKGNYICGVGVLIMYFGDGSVFESVEAICR
ncbi:MAG TPA: hypothetical protein DCM60_02195 [Nitrospina sp.]|nr:hypothetical protein [Nitrospina sp.]